VVKLWKGSGSFAKIKARYDEQVSPYYAASRLWTDAIIDPLDTRTWISMGSSSQPPIEKNNSIWSDSGLIHYYSFFRDSTLFSVQQLMYTLYPL
jgi:hypothetical protein